MSTRCSLAYASPPGGFHLYQEAGEDDAVYLEMEQVDVACLSAGGAMCVRIPLHIWEVLRHSTVPNIRFIAESYVGLTAQQLHAAAKASVKRAKKWQKKGSALSKLMGKVTVKNELARIKAAIKWYHELQKRMAALRKKMV